LLAVDGGQHPAIGVVIDDLAIGGSSLEALSDGGRLVVVALVEPEPSMSHSPGGRARSKPW
jgi:hypothetical protein